MVDEPKIKRAIELLRGYVEISRKNGFKSNIFKNSKALIAHVQNKNSELDVDGK